MSDCQLAVATETETAYSTTCRYETHISNDFGDPVGVTRAIRSSLREGHSDRLRKRPMLLAADSPLPGKLQSLYSS